MTTTLGPRHPEVRRLRAMLRDARARDAEQAFVLEGPRVVEGALDRGAAIDVVYLGTGAEQSFAELVARCRDAGARVAELKEGVLERVGSTRTPQPVLAVAPRVTKSLDELCGSGAALVAIDVSDPGNLGTMVRSAEAAGADAVVACGTSVDAQNPKAVRSSAGAIFGIDVIEADDPAAVLEALGRAGRRRVATTVAGGDDYTGTDLSGACALVVGNEARGVPDDVAGHVDTRVTIPMASGAESLNVATAATVLLFEAARQRRLAATSP